MRRRVGFFLALFFAVHSPAPAIERIRIAVSNPNMPNLTMAVAQKNGLRLVIDQAKKAGK